MPDPKKPQDLQDDLSANHSLESKDLQHADMQKVRRWLRLADQCMDSDQHQIEDSDTPESD